MAVLPAAGLPAESEVVYALHSGSKSMSAVDPVSGTLVATVDLSLPRPNALHPTPGGKYVFVSSSGSPRLAVVDVEAHELVRILQVGREDPVDVAFSPMGGRVFIAYEDSDVVAVYAHSQGSLSADDSFAFGDAGAPILFNRRGTRFYRAGGDDLQIGYVKTRELIATVDHDGAGAEYAFAPDFRFIWGIPQQGDALVVLDERRERVVKTIRGSFRRQILFNKRGSEAYVLEEAGGAIVVYATRGIREKRRLSLEEPAGLLAIDGNDQLWVAGAGSATLRALDPETGAVEHSITLSGPTTALSVVGLKPGQGFACF
jgi:DNA-binding beta-propeller fold protein YncE